ncbi:unnamed protein product [Hermetia illucens]|uniref:Uncharacterized protein n=1 Tax=Hermetia illucens TaxID=343691 RepID=A0A7R8UN45_HERIL|nr:unnamed protein product [Hermetia illucens]
MSNRGRKPMQMSIFASPAVISNLQQNRRKKTEVQKQKDDARANPAKQQKNRASVTSKKNQHESPTTDEDVDSCITFAAKNWERSRT